MRWLTLATLSLAAISLVSSESAAEVVGPAEKRVDVAWSQRTDVELPEEDHSSYSTAPMTVSNDIEGAFDMIGLLWDRGNVEEIWIQTKDASGEWSEWTEVPFSADHGGDSPQERPGSSPVYTGPVEAARFAIAGRLTGAEAMLIDTRVTPPSSLNSEVEPVPEPNPWWNGASFVRDREKWDTTDCRNPTGRYRFSTVRAVIVHHAGGNGYSQSAVPGIIRGFCNFHVNGRGWDDIGYNFLVDRFGDVWEGRTASKTSAIRGAHTTGFNDSTQGVAIIGNFQTQAPSTAQINSLRQILNWLTGWHSIDPTGRVTLYAFEPRNNLFEHGEAVTVPTIIGHRDLGQTACPGAHFYPMLPQLRASVVPVDFGIDLTNIRCDGRIPTIVGTPGPDQLIGTPGDDVIHGLAGNDKITGAAGNDYVCGGDGNDYLMSGSGVDSVFGGSGTDTCGADARVGCEVLINDEMFFYRNTGEFRYDKLNPDGTLGSAILNGSGYTTGWSSISAVDLDGDGQDEMLFYRDDGLFRYYQIDQNANLGSPILAGSKYTAGWSSISAVDLDGDGQDEIFFYREDGLYRYYNIASNGKIGSPIASGDDYTHGWDSITAVDLDGDGQDEMFFYRSDGLYRYYNIRPDGTLPSPIASGDEYTHGWDSITAVDLDGDGQDEMFFYRDDGLFKYYDIGANARLGLPIESGTGYSPGWSTITAIDVDLVPYSG